MMRVEKIVKEVKGSNLKTRRNGIIDSIREISLEFFQ